MDLLRTVDLPLPSPVFPAPDPRWSDDNLGTIRQVKGSDFEVVQMGEIVTQ